MNKMNCKFCQKLEKIKKIYSPELENGKIRSEFQAVILFEGSIWYRNNDCAKGYKLNYCPECGKKLG